MPPPEMVFSRSPVTPASVNSASAGVVLGGIRTEFIGWRGLAALATIAAAQTSAHGGSLVAGYQAAFLVSIGISVAAILVVAVQMRTPAASKGTA
jgi:hypothetical protein